MSEPEQLSGGGYLRLVLLGAAIGMALCVAVAPVAASVLRT